MMDDHRQLEKPNKQKKTKEQEQLLFILFLNHHQRKRRPSVSLKRNFPRKPP